MLNLTRLHLGIAHESQFQGLGISSAYSCLNASGNQDAAISAITGALEFAVENLGPSAPFMVPPSLCQLLGSRM